MAILHWRCWGSVSGDRTVIDPQYYSNDLGGREKHRERQLTTYEVGDLQGRKFSSEYFVANHHDLMVRTRIASHRLNSSQRTSHLPSDLQ